MDRTFLMRIAKWALITTLLMLPTLSFGADPADTDELRRAG